MESQALLFGNIDRHITLSDEERVYFLSLLRERHYSRKEYLLREGTVCNHFHFITKGCVKSYLLSRKGEEHILTIATADWWVADFMSFVFNQPCNLFIEAIEPVSTFILSRDNREALLRQVPQFEQYFRILTERAFAISQQRVTDMLSLTAAERLEQFRLRYGRIAPLLSQQQIASFIGVTPAFFSRMLRRERP